jgi:hypothetical protein
MAESLQLEEDRKAAAGASGDRHAIGQSAASLRAGQAAAERATNANRRFGANGKLTKNKNNNTRTASKKSSTQNLSSFKAELKPAVGPISGHHPNVKIPKQMKDKSKEEQILRCTKRLAPHPLAVDTLLRAFTFIQKDPDNSKYRKIDKSTIGYQKTLEGKPGVSDLLQAINFVTRPENPMEIILLRDRVDAAVLYLGISALEMVRESEEYVSAKAQITFERELMRIQNGENGNNVDDEVVKRANFISKLPSEPAKGAGALLQINLGDSTKIMRRFDGDDVLRDVMHFIGGHGTSIFDKIMSREWCIVDLNRYPIVPVNVDGSMDKTLQFIGCWPSGKLEIQPSTPEWRDKSIMVGEKMGSSRGLGAAPSSALN